MGYMIAAIVGGLLLITVLSGIFNNTRIMRKKRLTDKPSERDLDDVRITQRNNPYSSRFRR